MPFKAARYPFTFHLRYPSVYPSTGDFGDTLYTQAATLDTGPVVDRLVRHSFYAIVSILDFWQRGYSAMKSAIAFFISSIEEPYK